MNTPSPEQAAPRDETFPPGTAYMDGRFCALSEAKISILDWGFLRSDATYDVVHVWRRRFFRLDAHLDRFLASVDKLRLRLPFDRQGLSNVLIECARRSSLDDAYVEMICTRGRSPTYSRDPRDAVNRFIAFAIPFGWVADEDQRRRGLHLAIGTVTRIPPQSVDPTIKNYHWLDFVKGTFEAYEHGAETQVLVDEDANITEGPGFNLFAVAGGRVTTPRRGTPKGDHARNDTGTVRRTGHPDRREPAVGRPARCRRRSLHHLDGGWHHGGDADRRHPCRRRQAGPGHGPPHRSLLAKTRRSGLDHPRRLTACFRLGLAGKRNGGERAANALAG